MKRAFFLCAIVLLAAGNGFCGEKKKWDLQSLIEHSLSSRDDLTAQKEKIRQAEYKIKEAFSHYFPRLHFSAAYTKAESKVKLDLSDYKLDTVVKTRVRGQVTVTDLPGNPSYGFNVPVSAPISVSLPKDITLIDDEYGGVSVILDQPLFTWGRITNYVKAAKNSKKFENAKNREAQIDVIYQVRTAYYSFLVAREARDFADKVFQEIQTVRRLLQKQLGKNEGEDILKVTKLDLMEIEGFHLHTKGLRAKTSSAERSALAYLSLAAGLTKTLQARDIKGAIDIGIRLPLEVDCIAIGLKSNPLLEAVNSGIEAHNYLAKAERAAMLPVLGVRGFYKKLNTNGILKPDDYYGVSIVLKGPIFDSGEIWAKANQHLSKVRELSNRKTFLKSYLETSISTLYNEIKSLQTNLKIDRQEMELIDKRLRLALFGLMNKIVSYRDYKDAFVMRSIVKREYFERLLTFHEKVNLLIKMTGSANMLI